MSRCGNLLYRVGLVAVSLGILLLVVKGITQNNYNPLIENFVNTGASASNSEDIKLIFFHWKDCGHCKNMMSEWVLLEEAYPNNTMKVEKDEITAVQEREFKIQGYPTICLAQGNKKIKEYNGGRTFSEMEVFLNENMGSS
jgi:hypothetical protein